MVAGLSYMADKIVKYQNHQLLMQQCQAIYDMTRNTTNNQIKLGKQNGS
jgi:hypothetical protein